MNEVVFKAIFYVYVKSLLTTTHYLNLHMLVRIVITAQIWKHDIAI